MNERVFKTITIGKLRPTNTCVLMNNIMYIQNVVRELKISFHSMLESRPNQHNGFVLEALCVTTVVRICDSHVAVTCAAGRGGSWSMIWAIRRPTSGALALQTSRTAHHHITSHRITSKTETERSLHLPIPTLHNIHLLVCQLNIWILVGLYYR